MWNCKHCLKSFEFDKASAKANHSRWCFSNPKRVVYVEQSKVAIKAMNLAKEKDNFWKLKIKKLHNEGKYKNAVKKMLETKLKNNSFKHSEETKKKLSVIGLQLNYRRLRKVNIVHINKDNERVLLDSGWEKIVAERLDKLEIKWNRKKVLKWKDKQGKIHNYFPDFYLPEYDLYIEVKNPFLESLQQEKMNFIKKRYKIKILNSKFLCQNFTI